jgi:hypothetical protein
MGGLLEKKAEQANIKNMLIFNQLVFKVFSAVGFPAY